MSIPTSFRSTNSVSLVLGLKTVAIDIWGFSGVGAGDRFIADHGHSKRKTTASGFVRQYLLDTGDGERPVARRLGVELDLVEDAPDHGAAVHPVHAVVHVVVERRLGRLQRKRNG